MLNKDYKKKLYFLEWIKRRSINEIQQLNKNLISIEEIKFKTLILKKEHYNLLYEINEEETLIKNELMKNIKYYKINKTA